MFLLLLLVARVAAYPRGAPNSQCLTLEPGHGMVPQDNTRTPYSIQVAQLQVPPSSPVDLSLAASLQTFKGFIVQARDQEGRVIGTFVISQGDSKYLHCSGGPQSSVTHRDDREKRRVWLRWLPPAKFLGQVTFLATVVKDYNTYWVGLVSKPVLIEARKPLVSHDFEEDESELGDMEELQPVLDFFPSMEEQELEELHGTSPHEYDEFLPEEEDEEYGDDYVLGGFGDEFREDYSNEDNDSSPGGWHEDDNLPYSRPPPPPSPVSGLIEEEMEARRKEVEQIENERVVDEGGEITDEASKESSVRKEPPSSDTPEDAPQYQPDVAPPPPQYQPDVAPPPPQYQPDVAPQYQPRPRPHPERRPPTPWWMRGYRSGPPSLAQRGSQYPGQHSPQYGRHRRHRRRRSVASPYAQAYHRSLSLPKAHRRSPYSYSPLPYHRPYSPLPYHPPYNPSSRFSYSSHYSHRPRHSYQRYGADPFGQSYWRKATDLGTGGRWLPSHRRRAPTPGGSREGAGGGWDQQTRLSDYDGSGSGLKGEEAT